MTVAVADFDDDLQLLDHDVTPARRVVLIPVARFDRRLLAALRHARDIPAADRVAVHVVEDPAVADELELSWLCSGIETPLELLHTETTVAESISEAAADCLRSGAGEVIVVVGRQSLRTRRQRLLHDRSSEAIGRRVASLTGVVPVLVAVPLT